MSHLLARYAEAAFWMGRYVERAESLARVIDVNDTFSRSSRGIADWNAVLALYADEENFRRRYGEPTPQNVVHFYLFDRTNPGSIISSIQYARENARTLRPMISTEIWEHLNVFNKELGQMDERLVESPGLYRTCNRIKERCQTHYGVVEATMYRDETWYFCQLGTLLERGAQTAHYLDVRYRDLVPDEGNSDDDFDAAQWTALLRSQAGLHGYRRTTRKGITPRRVSEFLLFERRFPRSVASCINSLEETFDGLCQSFGLSHGDASAELISSLSRRLGDADIDTVIERGLHQTLDRIQTELYALSDRLHRDFFGRSP
ncbi:MAG: alpha-E domain-containing protein [Xanthomonadales bacterium]|nr:alpha-E domain-containing protein [Xanthomonadales bacterium]